MEDAPTPSAARNLSPVDSEGSVGSVIGPGVLTADAAVLGPSGRIRLLDAAPGVITADAAAAAAPAAAQDALPGVLTADAVRDAVPDAVPEPALADAPPAALPSGAAPSKHCAAHESVQRWASEQSTDQLQSNLTSLRKRSYAASG